jgi:hypothetical protein
MRDDFDSNRLDLEAMRDAAVVKIRPTQDAIEMMRDEYLSIQAHALLEEIQKAKECKSQLAAEVDAGVDYAPPLPDDLTPDAESKPEPLKPKYIVELDDDE